MHKNWYEKRQRIYKTPQRTENYTILRKLYKLKTRQPDRKEFFTQIISTLRKGKQVAKQANIKQLHGRSDGGYIGIYALPKSVPENYFVH